MRSGYVTSALVISGVLVVLLGLWPSAPLGAALRAVIATR
jgi:hypothetical protein